MGKQGLQQRERKGGDRIDREGGRGECCANASSKINVNQIGTEIT